MQVNRTSAGLLRHLRSVSLLGVAGLAVLAIGPGLLPTLGLDGAEMPGLSRPTARVAPSSAQPIAEPTTEAMVLANWEFTSHRQDRDDRRGDRDDRDGRHDRDADRDHGRPRFGDVVNDVLHSLSLASEANQDAAQVLLRRRSQHSLSGDREAANDVFQAYAQLAEGAFDARSPALARDAAAMLGVYDRMLTDLRRGNVIALFRDTQRAEAIANKAVLDASPYR